MRRSRVLAGYALYTIALAWPLDLLQYVPVLNVSMIAALTALLVGAAVLDVGSGQKLRVPFEALWPVATIAVLLIVMAYRQSIEVPFEAVGALILFVATTHFAGSRDDVERWMRASAVSGFLVCMTTLAWPRLGFMPTAFSLYQSATLSFAYDLAGGVHILALCFAIAFYFAASPSEQPIIRSSATACALLFGGTLVAKLILIALPNSAPAGPAFWGYPPLAMAACAMALWLFIRVLAKVEVRRRDAPHRFHLLLWSMALITLVFIAFGPVRPRLYHGYLLGLACAYALPERRPILSVAWPKAATATLAVIVTLNLAFVFPAHVSDPRNYEVATREDFRNADYETLLKRLDIIEDHAPRERRTHLWRARTALELHEPNGAAMAFVESLRPVTGRLLLPAPTASERAQFVVQIRDHTSTLSEDAAVCAYERALLAIGERDVALFSLQLLTGITLARAENVPPEALAEAAAFVFGEPSLEDDFYTWSTDELLTLFAQWGADIGPAPEGLSPDLLPAVFVVQRRLASIEVFVALGPSRHTFQAQLPGAPFRLEGLRAAPAQLGWSQVTAGEGGVQAVRAQVVDGTAVYDLGILRLQPGGAVAFQWSLDEDLSVPFTPGVRILVPAAGGS